MSVQTEALKFVDTIDRGRHVVLFYKEPDFARKIEYQYILTGLQNGESCIYTTHHREPINILQQMKEFGIDVVKYIQKNQLRVIKISDPRDHPDGFEAGLEQIREKLFDGINTPIRLVSRFIRQIESEDDIKINMMIEQKIQSAFDGHLKEGFFGNFYRFNGSFLCPYHVTPNLQDSDWMLNHIKNHHDIINSDEHTGSGYRSYDPPKEDISARQKNEKGTENKFLVEYKIKSDEEVYQIWMSRDSFNTLQWLVPLEYSKIIKTR